MDNYMPEFGATNQKKSDRDIAHTQTLAQFVSG
jgi:hypothetical protein